jgi:hypothetical protein
MTPEIELLEKYGLIRLDDIFRLEKFSPKKLIRLYEELYSTIIEQQRKRHWEEQGTDFDPFTFMASASLRADSTCDHYPCRASKLDFLARYTALYANNVILPVPLASLEESDAQVRNIERDLSRTIQSLLHLRPLIAAHIITPVVRTSFHCPHTHEWAGRMIEAVRGITADLARDMMPDFQVVYQLPEKSPTGESTLYVEGPKDLLEHGEIVWTWDETENWRLKSWRFDREGKVEIRGKRKLSQIYQSVFMEIANDTSFYLAFARLHSARYLSDRAGETTLLDALADNNEAAVTENRRLHAMAHMVPLLGDLPMPTLMRIRREDREAFGRYQYAIRNLLNEMALRKRHISKREVVELFREKIAPELLRMKSELRQERKRQTRRIVGGVASLAASIGLGAFGFLPIAAKVAAAGASAMMGGRLLTKAAEGVCEHGANLAAKNDFYFCLKLGKRLELSSAAKPERKT